MNILDTLVVFGSIFLFLLMIISSSSTVKIFEEVSEELILVFWSIFQTLRMILIIKKQNLAHQSAKTLIDFVNLNDNEITGAKNSEDGEEVIVFDMKQMEQRQRV